MFRIFGFLLLMVLLLALSFGWHPLATVKAVMGQREPYQVRHDGFNWLEQRKRRIEDAKRELREPRGLTDPESVVPSPMNGIDGAVPYSGIPKSGSTGARAMNDELFQLPIPTNTPTTTPGSKQK